MDKDHYQKNLSGDEMDRNLLKLVKLKKWLKKHFQMYSLCFIIFISLIALFYISKVYFDNLEERILFYKKNHTQITVLMNMLTEKITSLYNQLAVDGEIENWLRTNSYDNNIDYYSLYLTQKRLLNVMNSNPEIVSIYLHSLGNNQVLSTEFMFSALQEFPNRDLFMAFYNQKRNKKWFPAHFERDIEDHSDKVISFVSYLPLGSKKGAVAININENYLRNYETNGIHIVLLDESGRIISGPDLIDDIWLKKQLPSLKIGGANIQNFKIDNKRYYFYMSNLSFNDLKIISIVPQAVLVTGIRNKNNFVYIAFILSLIIAGSLFEIFRKIYVKPIQTYQENLREHIEDLKNGFYVNLLTGKYAKEELYQKANEFGINFSADAYLVIVFQINDYYNYLLNIKDNEILSMNNRILNEIKYILSEDKNYVVKMEFEKIAVLYRVEKNAAPEEIAGKVRSHIQQIQQKITNDCNLTICAGISESTSDLASIHLFYNQALRALNFKTIYGKNSIIFYHDMDCNNAIHQLNYPVSELNKISDFIKQHDIDKIEKCLDETCRKLTENQPFSIELTNAVFANTLYNIIKLILELRYEISDIFPADPFISLYSYEMLEDKKQFILTVCDQLINFQQKKEVNRSKATIQNILNYIYNNYDKCISLVTLADQLKMNSSYLSNLIKKELGVHFVDLINDLRLEKSLRLLRENKLNIKQIAESCGYDNVHTFIRNFKKTYLLTPSEYRTKSISKNSV